MEEKSYKSSCMSSAENEALWTTQLRLLNCLSKPLSRSHNEAQATPAFILDNLHETSKELAWTLAT